MNLLGLNTVMLINLLLFLTAVTNVAMLMGCNSKELMVVLSTCKLQAGKECIAKRLTLRQVCLISFYTNTAIYYTPLVISI